MQHFIDCVASEKKTKYELDVLFSLPQKYSGIDCAIVVSSYHFVCVSQSRFRQYPEEFPFQVPRFDHVTRSTINNDTPGGKWSHSKD